MSESRNPLTYVRLITLQPFNGDGSIQDFVSKPESNVVGLAIKVGDATPEFFSAEDIKTGVQRLQGHPVLVLDGLLDGLILANKLNVHPPLLLDLDSLSRSVDYHLKGAEYNRTLESITENFGAKRDFSLALDSSGNRILDVKTIDISKKYCEALRWCFVKLNNDVARLEFDAIDLTNKMFTQPQLEIDSDAILAARNTLLDRQDQIAETLRHYIPEIRDLDPKAILKILQSDQKISKLLADLGSPVPKGVGLNKDSSWVEAKIEAGSIKVSKLLESRLTVLSENSDLDRAEKYLELSRLGTRLNVGMRYFAAITSRWQSDRRDRTNMQGMAKASLCRTAIKAPKGSLVASSDFKGVELRIALHLSGDKVKIGEIANGLDPYIMMATQLMGVSYGNVSSELRSTAKEIVLSGIFGASGKSMRDSVYKNQRIRLGVEEAEDLNSKFRANYPAIVASWDVCGEALKQIARGGDCSSLSILRGYATWIPAREGFLIPNGVLINLPSLRENTQKGGYVFGTGKEENTIYGSKLFQYIVQASGRSLMPPLWKEARNRGIQFCLTIHDNVYWTKPISEMQESIAMVKKLMSTSPPWLDGIPLTTEIEVGENLGCMIPEADYIASLEPKTSKDKNANYRNLSCQISP